MSGVDELPWDSYISNEVLLDIVYLGDDEYQDEEWRLVPEFENYIVSSYGRVFNEVTEEFIKGRRAWNGSIRVKLSQNGRLRDVYVHTLVAELYFEDYVEGARIRHLNGDNGDNHIHNLEIVGPYREMGPGYHPEYRGGRLVRIKETGEVYPNVMSLAIALETDYSTIYKCLRGERIRHLGLTFEYVD